MHKCQPQFTPRLFSILTLKPSISSGSKDLLNFLISNHIEISRVTNNLKLVFGFNGGTNEPECRKPKGNMPNLCDKFSRFP
jgi:hypothetical protein